MRSAPPTGFQLADAERPVGIVEFAADEPRLVTLPHGDIAWYSSSNDVGTALSQAPVETVVLHVRFQEPRALVDTVRHVKELKPETRILLAASSTSALLIAEIRSLVSTDTSRRDELSGRERQVLSAIRAGRTNREIAQSLGIALSTVNRHVENILHKRSARNRAQAAAE